MKDWPDPRFPDVPPSRFAMIVVGVLVGVAAIGLVIDAVRWFMPD